MAMDGLSLAAVCCELSCLVGGKIDKVNQPERDLLLLGVRAGGTNHKLLLSAAADNCRVQLTKTAPPNPMDPPMFCMLLRKRIMGGRILSVEQPDLDRTLIIGIEARNELGDTVTLRLIAEVMGKHSNVILVNEQGIVQDAIRHVGISQS
ncbi:MAG: NFACT family protein, partial [Clostridia bacterium]|nr:NFACT family protein [Clostridia bacterium]